VENHSDQEVAYSIINQFPDTSLADAEKIIKRYRESDTWLTVSTISEESYKNLENIMIDNNLLSEYVPFDKLVVNLND
jgi:hypothetical protein